MILPDSSAWVEFLQATGSPQHVRVRALLRSSDTLVTTDIVVMELLAGARHGREREELRRLLHGRCVYAPVEGPEDYEQAADVYRACRGRGETIRRLTECLIAVVAMRIGAALLHRDRDFDAIARAAPLRLAAV